MPHGNTVNNKKPPGDQRPIPQSPLLLPACNALVGTARCKAQTFFFVLFYCCYYYGETLRNHEVILGMGQMLLSVMLTEHMALF